MDFLIQRENDIFPVEVKSEANTSSRSLKKFKELFPDQVKLRVRFPLNKGPWLIYEPRPFAVLQLHFLLRPV